MNKIIENIEYEKALLGAIINNGQIFEKVKRYLVKDDFFDEKNKIVFEAIDLTDKQGYEIELKPIVKNLKVENKLATIGGENYLNLLLSEAGLEKNVDKFAMEIVETAKLRDVSIQIKQISKEIKKDGISANDILEQVESKIIAAARENKISEFKSAKEIVNESLEEIRKKLAGEMVSGIPTEYSAIDKITGGLHKGELFILAARPSMGKTALALNIATNVAKKQIVAFFSLEMPSKALINRVIGFTGFITSNKIQDPKYMTESDKQKFTLSSEKTKKLKLFIDDTPGIKLSELVWKCKQLSKTTGVDLIVIDYLQLISTGGSGDNRQAEVATISRTLKKLARELNIPLIAISQLSRKVESRESKIPMMSDIRESGAIEQDADLIAFVYREAYYQNKIDKENNNNDPQNIQIIIGKHRNGPTGIVNLSFNPSYGLFLDEVKVKI